MRTLLINPFYPISETPSPPLGIAYLAAALEAAGVEVAVLDLVVHPYSQSGLEALLHRFRPQMVGITAVTMTFDNAIRVLNDVKHTDPDILTIMGGPHVTFCAHAVLTQQPAVDFVALGEGETTIVELATAADGRRNWQAVNGIAYRRGSEIGCTPARGFIPDLDRLPPPARHLLPLGRYRALGMPISMTTSRGCPYKCIFCVGRKMVGANVRYRSPVSVVDELEYLSGLNFHQVNIADDLFTANKKHCKAVCAEIIKRNVRVKWTSFARVDTVTDEVLAHMKAAGCSAVSFGIETANPEILKTIKKGITLEQATAAVKMCQRAGIIPHASFLLGLPGETPQTIQETMAFGERLHELGLSYGFHLLAPFPGTEVREQSDFYHIKILTNDWTQYHANKAIVETPSVNRQMLDDVVTAWEHRFNRYLEDIKNRMQTGQATSDEEWTIKNLERIVLAYDLMMHSVVEQQGAWRIEKNPFSKADALKMLVERIKNATAHNAEEIQEVLQRAFQKGDLKLDIRDGRVEWQWADTLIP